MDPSPAQRARAAAASRAHLVMAIAGLPCVVAGVGALTVSLHVVPSTLGALALALGTLSGPLAALALRWSTMRAVPSEDVPVPAAPAPRVRVPALTPHQRWVREFVSWRERPFER